MSDPLDFLSKDMLRMANNFRDGKASKEFLKKAGKKLQKQTIDVAQAKLKKKTGNYLKSIKSGKPYEFDGNLSVRTYSKAPHAHLIEFGHVTKNGGFKKGYRVFEEAASGFEKEFVEEVEKFIDEVIKESGF